MKISSMLSILLPCLCSKAQSKQEVVSISNIDSTGPLALSENLQSLGIPREKITRCSKRKQPTLYQGRPLILLHDPDNTTSVLFATSLQPAKPHKKKNVKRRRSRSKQPKRPEIE
mmetsp:Transcript_2430/g.5684  ORF Transcript_2430/g.5684 Transcript_2430/m.5684 type:complete len:115 (-) Transcript_2430:36-380(-)